MAGVLPGFEDGNARKFQLTNGGAASSRLPFSGLYATKHQDSCEERDVIMRAARDDEKLDTAAREAKKRLDKRLQRTLTKLIFWRARLERQQPDL